MKQISILTLLVFLFFACKPAEHKENTDTDQLEDSLTTPEETEVFNIEFSEYLKNKKDLFLSDIAESVSYVQIETTNEYLIGEKGLSVKPCGEFLFVGQHNSPLGVFDRNGKFIRTIGKIGKGPEEFNNDYFFYPEEIGRKIMFVNALRSSLMEYSWEGEFLREVKPELAPFHFAPVDDETYLIWTGVQIEDENGFYRLAFVGLNGKIIRPVYEMKREIAQGRSISFLSPLIMPGIKGITYNSWEEDLIYRVLPDTIFEPCLLWELGKYKMPFNPMDDFERYQREQHKYVNDIHALEGLSKWYVKYFYNNNLEMAVFDKANRELVTVNNPDREQKGLVNDIDGGPSFWPFWDAEKGSVFFRMIPAIDLLNYKNEQLNYQGTPKNPEAARYYKELISKLKEDSNPVLMTVKLK